MFLEIMSILQAYREIQSEIQCIMGYVKRQNLTRFEYVLVTRLARSIILSFFRVELNIKYFGLVLCILEVLNF
jgi:hypothetical protein